MANSQKVLESPGSSAGGFAEGAQLLQAYEPTDLAAARRLIAVFARQPHTVAGFPRVRPSDCARITVALEGILAENAALFRMGDPVIVRQFNAILDAFSQTDVRAYSNELQRVVILQTRTRLMCGDVEGAHALIAPLAERPYAIELDFERMMDALALDLQCTSLLGKIDECASTAGWRVRMLMGLRPFDAWTIGWRFASFIALRPEAGRRHSVIDAMARFWANALARLREDNLSGRKLTRPEWARSRVCAAMLGVSLLLAHARDKLVGPPNAVRRSPKSGDIVVTRAMGGIGDLLMMTPGLRALSRRHGRRVKMVVPAKFFDVFANNPHVDLVDMDGPPVDVESAYRWYNLSNCPATAYEAPNRPFTKKGRVELFAGGMEIPFRRLRQTGQRIDIILDQTEIDFRNSFLESHGLGRRPLIGVQPFSREEYRNYSGMNDVIERLSRDADVIVFHHRADGIVSGPGIFSTKGFSLRLSFALVSALDVLVSVDSSFLHAASAFDIPVVALFGPIDGDVRTRHLNRVHVIMMRHQFPCVPCWRNEDEDCLVTRHTGASPCLEAVPVEGVIAAARNFVGARHQTAPTS